MGERGKGEERKRKGRVWVELSFCFGKVPTLILELIVEGKEGEKKKKF